MEREYFMYKLEEILKQKEYEEKLCHISSEIEDKYKRIVMANITMYIKWGNTGGKNYIKLIKNINQKDDLFSDLVEELVIKKEYTKIRFKSRLEAFKKLQNLVGYDYVMDIAYKIAHTNVSDYVSFNTNEEGHNVIKLLNHDEIKNKADLKYFVDVIKEIEVDINRTKIRFSDMNPWVENLGEYYLG
jgi:hypothetical protein